MLKWHVEVGQKVEEFDNLCEVQSDKSVYVGSLNHYALSASRAD